MTSPFRIGTRGSALALAQARQVAEALERAHGPSFKTEIVVIKTTGDAMAEKPLPEIGGKGVFVKEIEKALLDRSIDAAVHSMKDLPALIPDGLKIAAVPRREDPRDCVISRFGEQLEELPRGAVVGTGSLRRRAQIKVLNKKVRVEPVRGNLDTRVRKLQAGDFDSIVVALAGVRRLGLASEVSQILPPETLLPAPGQGCLAVETREDDMAALTKVAVLDDRESRLCALAERALSAALGADCRVPVGGLARIEGETLRITGLVADLEGTRFVRGEEKGALPVSGEPADQAVQLIGSKLGGRLLIEGASEILFELRETEKEELPEA